MDKNWLIRTSQKQILGPISKMKLREFIQKKLLSEEDEICSGNGYWFFIREKELLSQYLLGDATQDFNPVSETKDVVSVGRTEPEPVSPSTTEQTLVLDLEKIKSQEWSEMTIESHHHQEDDSLEDHERPDSTQVISNPLEALKKKADTELASSPSAPIGSTEANQAGTALKDRPAEAKVPNPEDLAYPEAAPSTEMKFSIDTKNQQKIDSESPAVAPKETTSEELVKEAATPQVPIDEKEKERLERKERIKSIMYKGRKGILSPSAPAKIGKSFVDDGVQEEALIVEKKKINNDRYLYLLIPAIFGIMIGFAWYYINSL